MTTTPTLDTCTGSADPARVAADAARTAAGSRRVVLAGVVGSTAYGLAHAGSDVDTLGVFVADTERVLGLGGHGAVSETVATHHPTDVTLHELGKYCALALQANPTVLELMYLGRHAICDEIGAELVALRASFLSTQAVRGAFGGYAAQQARRLARRHAEGKVGFSADLARRTAKHGRHCARLLHCGTQLLATGELNLDVSALRDELFAAGELAACDPDAFADAFAVRLAKLDSIRSVLPDQPDRAAVEAFVVGVRSRLLDRR